jgi:YbaB/EbfC DNA-binding family
MSSQQRSDDPVASYQQRRTELIDFQHQMQAVTATVVAPRQVVSVTVGNGGQVTELKFPTAAYKNLSAAELASTIVKTIRQAAAEALDKAADLLSPMLPFGMDARQLLSGQLDVSSALPESVDDITRFLEESSPRTA